MSKTRVGNGGLVVVSHSFVCCPTRVANRRQRQIHSGGRSREICQSCAHLFVSLLSPVCVPDVQAAFVVEAVDSLFDVVFFRVCGHVRTVHREGPGLVHRERLANGPMCLPSEGQQKCTGL